MLKYIYIRLSALDGGRDIGQHLQPLWAFAYPCQPIEGEGTYASFSGKVE